MEDKILIVLRGRDQIEDLIPYLERVAKPGMKLVCLIPYPVESREYFRDYWATTDSTRSAMLTGRNLIERYSWETQKQLAEKKVTAVREAMKNKSVNVEIDFCTGSLKRIVLDRTTDRDIRWVIIPAQLSRLLGGDITPFAQFKWALFCSRTSPKEDAEANERLQEAAHRVEKLGT